MRRRNEQQRRPKIPEHISKNIDLVRKWTPTHPKPNYIFLINEYTAKCRVRELFERRIVTTLANDIIISVGLSLLAASAIIVYVLVDICFFSIVLLQVFSENKGIEWYAALNPILLLNNQRYFYLDVYQVVGYITCLLVVLNVLEVVNSGYKAVFVCFVQVNNSDGGTVSLCCLCVFEYRPRRPPIGHIYICFSCASVSLLSFLFFSM